MKATEQNHTEVLLKRQIRKLEKNLTAISKDLEWSKKSNEALRKVIYRLQSELDASYKGTSPQDQAKAILQRVSSRILGNCITAKLPDSDKDKIAYIMAHIMADEIKHGINITHPSTDRYDYWKDVLSEMKPLGEEILKKHNL